MRYSHLSKSFLLSVALLCTGSARAQVRTLMEGIPSSNGEFLVSTTTRRVDIATTTYVGHEVNVGLHVSSNVVIDSAAKPDACVFYASGTITCLGVTLSGAIASTVTVVSPLSGIGSSFNPVALTGAIPTGQVNLSTVSTQLAAVGVSTTALSASTVTLAGIVSALGSSTNTFRAWQSTESVNIANLNLSTQSLASGGATTYLRVDGSNRMIGNLIEGAAGNIVLDGATGGVNASSFTAAYGVFAASVTVPTSILNTGKVTAFRGYNNGSGPGTGASIGLGVGATDGTEALIAGVFNGTGLDLVFFPEANLSNTPNEVMRITSPGKVGIGTNSPPTYLSVSGVATGATNNGQLDVIDSLNTLNRVSIGYADDLDYGFIDTYENGIGYKNLALQENGGNLGVGTIVPVYKLDVAIDPSHHFTVGGNEASVRWVTQGAGAYTLGQMDASTLALNADSGGNVAVNATSSVDILRVHKSTDRNLFVRSGTDIGFGGGTSIGLDSLNDAATLIEGFAIRGTTVDIISDGGLQLQANSGGVYVLNGNLGVNTTSPKAALQIGNGAGTNLLSEDVYINKAGNAGFSLEDSNNAAELAIQTSGGNGDIGMFSGGDLKFVSNTTEYGILTHLGKWGFDTLTPGSTLDDNGDATIRGQETVTGTMTVVGSALSVGSPSGVSLANTGSSGEVGFNYNFASNTAGATGASSFFQNNANGALTLWSAPSVAAGATPSVTASIVSSGSLVGINTSNLVSNFNVYGSAQFGTGVNVSTFDILGDLTLGSGSSINLAGSDGFVTGRSSITASAFFGDASHLTGIASGACANGNSGTGSVRCNGTATTVLSSATAAYAFAGPGGNSVSGQYSASFGNTNLNSGTECFVSGVSNNCNGGLATGIIGQSITVGGVFPSVAMGYNINIPGSDYGTFTWNSYAAGGVYSDHGVDTFNARAPGGVFFDSATVSVMNGVVVSSTPVPSISCNNGTGILNANSGSQSGSFAAGTLATSCTVTFASGFAFPKTPSCFCNGQVAGLIVNATAMSTTALTCGASTALTGDTINYFCWSQP